MYVVQQYRTMIYELTYGGYRLGTFPAEIIDGLMQWVEQYTNVLHEISVAETLDDLKELKQNAACPDIRPDVAIWALRRIVRVIMAADCLYQRLCRES